MAAYILVVGNGDRDVVELRDNLQFEGYASTIVSNSAECIKSFRSIGFKMAVFCKDFIDDSLSDKLETDDTNNSKTRIKKESYSVDSASMEIVKKYKVPVLIVSKEFNSSDSDNGISYIKYETGSDVLYKIHSIMDYYGRTEKLGVAKLGDNIIVDGDKFKTYKDGKELPLTPNETRLLAFICNHKENFVDKELIVKEFFDRGDVYFWAEEIENRMSKIGNILEDNPKKPVYIKYFVGLGYSLKPFEEIFKSISISQ